MNQQVHLIECTMNPNTLLINESLSKNLNLKINEKIKVQDQLFTIIGL
jgi:putative ABC transport system permease protein